MKLGFRGQALHQVHLPSLALQAGKCSNQTATRCSKIASHGETLERNVLKKAVNLLQ